MNLIAELSGAGFNAQYATGSRAFTENLRKLVGPRARNQFKYFATYQLADRDDVDVLICDETHRIRETGNQRYTPAAKKSDRPLIEHVIEAAKVPVFFIDDLQVRPDEVGSTDLIKEAPPSDELLEHMLALPPSDRAVLAEILGAMALKMGRRKRERQGTGWPAGNEP